MILKQLNQIEDKAERLAFILANKREIIRAKKHSIKHKRANMPVLPIHDIEGLKAAPSDSGLFTIVGNSVGFFDSHHDVSMKGSFNRTVQQNGKFIQILNSHRSDSISDIIAANRGVFIQDMPIKALGYDRDGNTEVLAANIEPLSPSVAKRYEMGAITQHSIGLQYIKLELAVNDPSQEEEYGNWTRNINKVINKEDAIENGYMWLVFEQKVFEISAVVFGSNGFTPNVDYIGENSQELEQSPTTIDPPKFGTQQDEVDATKQDLDTRLINLLSNEPQTISSRFRG